MKRVGLTGCGGIGRLHARNLRGQAQLLFHNRTRARAEQFALEFGGELCETYGELVERADGVVIATPPECHEEETIAALSSGVGVMVEKPLCATAEELVRIAEAARRYDVATLVVAENYYYKPSLMRLKEHIASGAIGDVRRIDVKKMKKKNTTDWRSAYGALIEGGIHFVALASDLLDAATGSECGQPLLQEAEFPTARPGVAERHSVLRLQAAGGPTATVHFAWDVPSVTGGLFQHSHLIGSEGDIVFESNGIYQLVRGRRRRLEFPGFRDILGYQAMTADFLNCLENPERRPYSNIERGQRDLQIVLEAYASLASD